MNYGYPDLDLLACMDALVPWIGGLTAKVTLLAAAILLAGFLVPRRHAALRHLVATLGLVCLAVLPVLSLSVSWKLDGLFGEGTATSHLAGAVPAVSSLPGMAEFLPAFLMKVWGVGAGLFLLWLAADFALLWNHVRRGAGPASPGSRLLMDRIVRRLGIRQQVRVLSTDAIDIPCTWGLLRPVVLLPRQAHDWTQERLETVLLHEAGHLRRRDVFFTLLSRIICAFYWFHPLVWWVERRVREEAEHACDQLVIEQGIAPARYARHLVEFIHDARRPAALAPSMAGPSHLSRRITALINHHPGRSRVGRTALLIAVSVAFTSTVLIAAAVVPGTVSPHQEEPACSDAGWFLESQEFPQSDGLQSVEPEPFTPMEHD